ncbi:MAG: cupin domain-containing protein [Tepidiformaceae bacterium]
MKVLRIGDTPEAPATAPIFVGEVHSRPLVDKETSPAVTVTMVRFSDGAKNKRHTHSADQILYITDGEGIVADEAQEHRVAAGDIVHVPAGEVHWHGATPGGAMAHLSILPPCETKVVDEG